MPHMSVQIIFSEVKEYKFSRFFAFPEILASNLHRARRHGLDIRMLTKCSEYPAILLCNIILLSFEPTRRINWTNL